MNSKKIAFIICVNNELYFEECCWYINRLHIPEFFEIDIISVREASSMAEGYNAAMESSDAKYKVYLHQDVFIYNQNFISDMLNIFQADEAIGMMGLVGGVNLPKTGIVYWSWNCGMLIASNYTITGYISLHQEEPYVFVEALDGLLLATQYDIRWRDDILKQWDFYDISQSFEFRKAGYDIVIPYQNLAWVNHDCGYNKLAHYNENRRIVLEAYSEFFHGAWKEEDFTYPCELELLTEQLCQEIVKRIDAGWYEEAEVLLKNFEDNHKDNKIILLKHIIEISQIETAAGVTTPTFRSGLTADELLERYTRIKFYLRRIEMEENTTEEEVLSWIQMNEVSFVEVMKSISYNIIDKKRVLERIVKAYRLGNDEKAADILESYI